ncbi:hypothetical protein Hanom_Chr04g00324641 [Helianthus anomalus]
MYEIYQMFIFLIQVVVIMSAASDTLKCETKQIAHSENQNYRLLYLLSFLIAFSEYHRALK